MTGAACQFGHDGVVVWEGDSRIGAGAPVTTVRRTASSTGRDFRELQPAMRDRELTADPGSDAFRLTMRHPPVVRRLSTTGRLKPNSAASRHDCSDSLVA